MKWTNKGHQFDELAKEICKGGEYEYYIWGAGITGGMFYRKFRERLNIIGFIDSSKEKQQAGYEGLNVLSIDKVEKNNKTRIVVSPAYYKEISSILDERGWKKNVEYFESHIFGCLLLMYKYNEVYIHRTDISLTERCTLRCKKCNMYMPYFKEPKDRPLEEVKEDLDVYFKYVSYVNFLNLLGGEPFLYPYLAEVLEYLGENYGKKIGHIEIFTNGTVLPRENELELMRKYAITVGISDYTKNIPYGKRLGEILSALEENKVSVRREIYSEWLDFGFPENNYQITKDETMEEHFTNCGEVFRGLFDKKYYYCHLNTSAVRANIFPDNKNDYFDLSGDVKKMELLEYDQGYCNIGYNTFCTVCRGCQSKLKIGVAEQVR